MWNFAFKVILNVVRFEKINKLYKKGIRFSDENFRGKKYRKILWE